MSRSGFDIALIDQDEDLRRLLPAWWDLWSRLDNATPFASPAWLLPWWRVFRPGPLMTVAVRRHGRLVGLAPGYVEEGPWGRRLLPLGIGASDYLDVLIDPAVEGVAEHLVAAVLQRADRWDHWDLEELFPEAAALSLPLGAETTQPRPQSACPVLPLSALPDWPQSRAGRRWRRAWNRVERHARIEVEAATPANVQDLLGWLIALHGRRWNRAGQSGVLATPEIQAFHREAAPRLLDSGLLQLFGLRLEGRMVGVYYGFAHRRRAFGYLNGFDPEWTFESPGTALLGYAIRQAIQQGCDEFHFLRGQEPYKYAWGAVDRWNQARRVTSPRAAPSLAQAS